MSLSEDTDLLPLTLAGLILLIMGAAVAMYSAGQSPAPSQGQGGAIPDDSPFALPASPPAAISDSHRTHGGG